MRPRATPHAAYRANRDGPALLARLCAEADIPLIHVSTDYVFDGSKPEPYVETDPVAPQGVYGASKLAGEQAVMASGAKAIILRTAWVYAATGKNFVRTMLTVGKTRDRLTVVADQHGCPTSAADLADAILGIIAGCDPTGWQRLPRHLPCRGRRRNHLARPRRRHVRGGRPPRRESAGGGTDRHRRLADTGEAAGELTPGLQPTAQRIRRPPAALAEQPGPDGRYDLRHRSALSTPP